MAWRRSKTGQIIWYINRTYRVLPTIIVLDMDSSVSPTYGDQEGTAYNGHFPEDCRSMLAYRNNCAPIRAMPVTPRAWSVHGRRSRSPILQRRGEAS